MDFRLISHGTATPARVPDQLVPPRTHVGAPHKLSKTLWSSASCHCHICQIRPLSVTFGFCCPSSMQFIQSAHVFECAICTVQAFHHCSAGSHGAVSGPACPASLLAFTLEFAWLHRGTCVLALLAPSVATPNPTPPTHHQKLAVGGFVEPGQSSRGSIHTVCLQPD